jgi:hypothetical protein
MLKWVFGADTSPFRRSLNEMRNGVKEFSTSAKSQIAGIFGVGAITAWVSVALDAAGRIDDLSKRLNISAESFQRLSFASKLSGGNMELIGKALTFLSKNLAIAQEDSSKFSESASVLNLNLEELAKLSPEGQMIELARGYEQSANKGAALNAIMKLLGKSGAEVIPMLAGGASELEGLFDQASVQTNEQISILAKAGDAIDALKMKSFAFFGNVISGFQIAGASAEFFLNTLLQNGKASEILEKRFDSIRGLGKGGVSQNSQIESAKKQADLAKKQEEIEKERLKLVAEIAKIEEDSRIKALSLSEKILDAEKRRAKLAAESIFGEDGNKSLEARKEELKIEQEIDALRTEQANQIEQADKAASDAKRALSENLVAALDAEEKAARDAKFSGAGDQEKMKMLREELALAEAQAKEFASNGDKIGATEKRTEAISIRSELEELAKSARDQARGKLEALQARGPAIATSELASIGGGGGARLMETDYLQKQVALLEIIAANTAGGSEGSRPPEPIT